MRQTNTATEPREPAPVHSARTHVVDLSPHTLEDRPRVLVVDETERFATELRVRLPHIEVRVAQAPDDTEGIGIHVVVVAGPYPVRQLAELRVHPELSHLPVILVAPKPLGPDAHSKDPLTLPITAARDTITKTVALLERLVRWRPPRAG